MCRNGKDISIVMPNNMLFINTVTQNVVNGCISQNSTYPHIALKTWVEPSRRLQAGNGRLPRDLVHHEAGLDDLHYE